MRVVIQRAISASVKVDGKIISEIDNGIVTLMGFSKGDQPQNIDKALAKIIDLRIFEDASGKMNLSLKDVNGQHLIISQFTLAGDCSQGRRPSFVNAESPEKAKVLYEYALQKSSELGVKTFGGQFQADMKVSLINDGPVTFVLDF